MFSPQIQVLLWAMAPISELRGAIPIGVSLDLPFWEVFLISLFGNIFSVFLVALCLKPVSNFLSGNSNFFKRIFDWIFERTRKKFKPLVEKYGKLALILFVAIPLPITGGWTGAIAAFLFGISIKKAMPLISIGILIAGTIVSIMTLTGFAVKDYFGYGSLFLVVAMAFALYFFYKFIVEGKRQKL